MSFCLKRGNFIINPQWSAEDDINSWRVSLAIIQRQEMKLVPDNDGNIIEIGGQKLIRQTIFGWKCEGVTKFKFIPTPKTATYRNAFGDVTNGMRGTMGIKWKVQDLKKIGSFWPWDGRKFFKNRWMESRNSRVCRSWLLVSPIYL